MGHMPNEAHKQSITIFFPMLPTSLANLSDTLRDNHDDRRRRWHGQCQQWDQSAQSEELY